MIGGGGSQLLALAHKSGSKGAERVDLPPEAPIFDLEQPITQAIPPMARDPSPLWPRQI